MIQSPEAGDPECRSTSSTSLYQQMLQLKFSWDAAECLHGMPAGFTVGSKMAMPCFVTYHKPL
jgi:hypothetical protein